MAAIEYPESYPKNIPYHEEESADNNRQNRPPAIQKIGEAILFIEDYHPRKTDDDAGEVDELHHISVLLSGPSDGLPTIFL
jgi:hypothetical protein